MKSELPKSLKSNSLPQFGKDGWATDNGYDITHIVGWLETLIQDEDVAMSDRVAYTSARWRRYEKACDALELLTEVMESEKKTKSKKRSPFWGKLPIAITRRGAIYYQDNHENIHSRPSCSDSQGWHQ